MAVPKTGPYSRVKVEGHTINRRTASVFAQTKIIFATLGGTGDLHLVQGSYNGGKGKVSASAGTHDGGGAMDIVPIKKTPKNWRLLQKARRMCGEAAWDRPDLPGEWDHHDHGIVIGDKEMSSGARRQVQDYYAHLNGLASHSKDPSWHPSVLFAPSYPLANVDLSNVVREAKATPAKKVPMPGVKAIQSTLNLKSGTHLKVDGIFGKDTVAAYKRWESSWVGQSADGIPGPFTLTLLGAGRFNVKA